MGISYHIELSLTDFDRTMVDARDLDNQIAEDCAQAIWSNMVEYTPVDTGEMISSETYRVEGGNFRLESPVYYSVFVEAGHRTRGGGYVAGQFYMQRSAQDVDYQSIALRRVQGIGL